MPKNVLRFIAIFTYIVAGISFIFYSKKLADNEADKVFWNNATDECKQEYIDYNLSIYWR